MTPADHITVAVCTRNRSGPLSTLLDDLSRQKHRGSWDALVVDNGSSDDTSEVVSRYQHSLRLRAVHEPTAGKSRGLNRALVAITHGWCVFTDDDVRVRHDWLTTYAGAFSVPRRAC